MTHELLHLDGNTEIRGQQGNKTVTVAYLSSQQAREKELSEIPYVIPLAGFASSDTLKRANVNGKSIVAWSVEADCGVRLRPCSIKEKQKAMVEHIEETHECRIACIYQSCARLLSEVQRERAVWAEKTEKSYFNTTHFITGRGIAG